MDSHAEYSAEPDESLSEEQLRYLAPYGPCQRLIRRGYFAANRLLVRLSFRLHVTGRDRLPETAPLILAPSHTSSLDPFVLAAALPFQVMRRCRWAAAGTAVRKNAIRKIGNRLGGSVPVARDGSALTVGAAILERGLHLIWFPEGRRTRDGNLQELKPGIGMLATAHQVPVVPIRILGAYEAMPPGKRFPRIGRRIEVRIGEALTAEPPPGEATSEEAAERFCGRLHAALSALGE